jgi:hypothetical protein
MDAQTQNQPWRPNHRKYKNEPADSEEFAEGVVTIAPIPDPKYSDKGTDGADDEIDENINDVKPQYQPDYLLPRGIYLATSWTFH